MEKIANTRGFSLYSPSNGMVLHARLLKVYNLNRETFEESDEVKEIKDSCAVEDISTYVGVIEKGNARTLCNLQTGSDNMYVRYEIYRRIKDGTFCIIVTPLNGDPVYCCEI
jgi:hypothetical protein